MKTITLAHSELTRTIYAIIGKEKIDITNQAIAEVEAINALEQPTSKGEKVEELISRKAVLDLFEFIGDMPTIDDYGESLREVVDIEAIKALPPVTPKQEPKKGHWIYWHREDLGEKLNHMCECSECRKWFSICELIYRDYCPSCGAKMESEG